MREDSELTKMFTSLPTRCIVLLEDIDAVGVKRQPAFPEEGEDDEDGEEEEDEDRGARTRCTLSGLLNVLDGVASQEGRIVIMTSNHAEKLDKALVRPGRIDRKIYLGPISQRSAELMFLRMYSPDPTAPAVRFELEDGELEKLALGFSLRVTDQLFTPAQLQGFLLNHRDFPARAVEEVAAWVKEETVKMEEEKVREKKMKKWRKEKKERALTKALEKMAKEEGVKMEESGDEESEKGEKKEVNGEKRLEKVGGKDVNELVDTEK